MGTIPDPASLLPLSRYRDEDEEAAFLGVLGAAFGAAAGDAAPHFPPGEAGRYALLTLGGGGSSES